MTITRRDRDPRSKEKKDRKGRAMLNPWASPKSAPLGSLGPRDSWAAAKQIDGIPGEWTYPLWGCRAMRFHGRKRVQYDRLQTYDSILEWALINQHLHESHLPVASIRLML